MQRLLLICKVVCLAVASLLWVCSPVTKPNSAAEFSFSVIDVGEGLAQLGCVGQNAILWDTGDSLHINALTNTIEEAGSPLIEAIVISHSHSDHFGGLSLLPRETRFSGLVVTHAFEDTAYIRKCAGYWQEVIRFTVIGQGDSLNFLPGVTVTCLWPPKAIHAGSLPLVDSLKNAYSLCFSIRYHDNSLLITSDIDTFSEHELSNKFGFTLAHDIIVSPHHGSAGSIDPVFYGYVNPHSAIISCGVSNSYGHPSGRLLDLLFQMRVQSLITAQTGTVSAIGNGYYWTWKTRLP